MKLLTAAGVATCRPRVAWSDEYTAFLTEIKRKVVFHLIDVLVRRDIPSNLGYPLSSGGRKSKTTHLREYCGIYYSVKLFIVSWVLLDIPSIWSSKRRF